MKKTFLLIIFNALILGIAYLKLSRNSKHLVTYETELSRELVHPLYDGIIASSKMGRFIRLLLQ